MFSKECIYNYLKSEILSNFVDIIDFKYIESMNKIEIIVSASTKTGIIEIKIPYSNFADAMMIKRNDSISSILN